MRTGVQTSHETPHTNKQNGRNAGGRCEQGLQTLVSSQVNPVRLCITSVHELVNIVLPQRAVVFLWETMGKCTYKLPQTHCPEFKN